MSCAVVRGREGKKGCRGTVLGEGGCKTHSAKGEEKDKMKELRVKRPN